MLDQVSKASKTVFPLNPLTWSEINNKIGGCFSFQLPVPSYLDTASGPNSSHTKRKSNLSTHPLSPSMGPCTYLESTGVPWNTKRRLGNSRRTTVGRKWEGPRRADLQGVPVRGQRAEGSGPRPTPSPSFPTFGSAEVIF